MRQALTTSSKRAHFHLDQWAMPKSSGAVSGSDLPQGLAKGTADRRETSLTSLAMCIYIKDSKEPG